MTLHAQTAKQKKWTAGQLYFGVFGIFCLLLILRNSDIAIEYMNRGLLLCAKTVIPSLFPFMVLSELIISGGIGTKVIGRITKPFQKLLGLPDAGCCAVILGMLCGFPVGAKCAILAYEQKKLTRKETERVLTFSNNPSSAFMISAVGVSLWGNRRFGLALYGTVLLVGILTGILSNLLKKKDPQNTCNMENIKNTELSLPRGAKLFTDAVKSATGSMLLVCAYVIFFSTLVGTLNIILNLWNLPTQINAILFCLFELSSGISQAASLGNTSFAAILCAFAAGWSGLSVHCQILSVCDGKGLSFRPYFLSKLFQGFLCALLFGILIHLFPELTVPAEICLK